MILMTTFDGNYYDYDYFASGQGKQYRRIDGSEGRWGYRNPDGHWDGCNFIVKALKDIFNLVRCDTDTGLCKVLDIGCGRGQFVTALRDVGIEGWGFDFSEWAIENRYKRCEKGWIIRHDAIDSKGWPYGSNAFDLTLALDFFEHIYSDDLNFIIDEMYRVSKKWIFLEIAVCGSGGLQGQVGFEGYILNKGDKIPVELESIVVAGHVTVQPKQFWVDKLLKDSNGNERKWRLRDDMVQKFIENVPAMVISNWTLNAILILEKI